MIRAEGAWAESFIDDDSRGMFQNAHEYATLYPDEQPVLARYYAPRLEDGFEVEHARAVIVARTELAGAKHNSGLGRLLGQPDHASDRIIQGWAQNLAHPDVPVCLDIVIDGIVAMQTLANIYRPDLAKAGIGTGHHSFKAVFPAPFSLDAPHAFEVRRSADGVALSPSAELLKASLKAKNLAAA